MVAVDLDAAAAARNEARDDGPVIRFKGEEFQLGPELPLGVVESLSEMARASDEKDGAAMAVGVMELARAIMGEHYERFAALGPSADDLEALVEGVMPHYGLGKVGVDSAA